MSLLAQHGYGKSDKINRAFQEDSLTGVILSPKDELPDNMVRYIMSIREKFPSKEVLFDPQFYIFTRHPVNDGRLPDYTYYKSQLNRRNFFSPYDIEQYVEEVISYQEELCITKIVSPTVYVDDLNNKWSQIALTLAQHSLTYHKKIEDAPPLLISLCINEKAILNRKALNELLDMISLLDVHGFYILISSNKSAYTPQIEPDLMEQLLYLTYTLSINEYEIVFGYSNFSGIPLHAVGATYTACGWFNKLKRFSIDHFTPRSGGRQARPTYTCKQLLNSILIIPELETIKEVDNINKFLAYNGYDDVLRTNPGDAPWPRATKCLHHWKVLNDIITHIEQYDDINSKLDYVYDIVLHAIKLYDSLETIPFENKSSSAHLLQWRKAIDNFREDIGV